VPARALHRRGHGRRVAAGKSLDLLLLAAAPASSLSDVARPFRFGFSHESARKALAAKLADLDGLTDGLLGALHLLGFRSGLSSCLWRGALPPRAGAPPPAASGCRGAEARIR